MIYFSVFRKRLKMISVALLAAVLINTVFLLVRLLVLVNVEKDKKFESIVKAETAIISIAFTQYALTFIIENSNVLEKDSELFAQQLRYLDWLITTPLLLYTFWKLANVYGYDSDFILLLFADIVMILAGIVAEFTSNKTLAIISYLVGMVAYGIIIWKVVEIMNFFKKEERNDERNLGWFFILGWAIYPVAFILPVEPKYILFSIGDFINKGIYSIALSDCLT
jgi:sensory rhodopsin